MAPTARSPLDEAEARPATPVEAATIVELGRRVVEREADGLLRLAADLGDDFVAVVRGVLECRGRVVVMGVGKSGHVGRKIAASLASTGTPAFFVHGDEALHGDLGAVTGDDLVLLISNSGETHELLAGLPSLARIGARLVSLTGTEDCTLARCAELQLVIGPQPEADHLGLAPSTSAAATLALGDALALTVSALRGFARERFALYHPGGKLGERLTGKAT